MDQPREPSLAPLRAAAGAVDTLRAGPPEAVRSALLRVANATEAALRRLLRDDDAVPVSLRLRALAPDELSLDALIAELRQRDRISIELAASFHDLLRVRHRLEEGGDVTPADRDLALRTVELLEHDARAVPLPPPVAPPEDPIATVPLVADEMLVHPVPPPSAGRARMPPWLWAVGVAALVLALLGVWWGVGRRGGSAELEEGITLFRSGALAEAAPHFRRYAEAHPDDPTPRLYLARIYRRAGRLDEASSELRQALAVAPDDAALQRELGFLLLDAHRYDAAVQRFRSAIALDSEAPEGWIGLIRALRASGQVGAAQRVLARAPAEVRALERESPPN